MKTITIPLFLFLSYFAFPQVGVGNTDPKAILDISASSTTSPSNEDGILIPRIDNFPSTNPTADQDGMMVFYTGNALSGKGFYYWDNSTTSWISVKGTDSDSDFFEIGTSNPPNSITDDIYTYGKIKIGQNSTALSPLSIHDWDSSNASSLTISRSLNTASGSGSFNGAYITLNANTSDNYFGVNSFLSGNIQAESANFQASATGTFNAYTNLFSGRFYSASGSGRLYGANINFTSGITNTGNKYGFNINIPSSLSGIHYGLYSNVQNTSGYAAYLLGRTSLGETTANRYLMPAADGTAGQVLTTDGAGNLAFTTINTSINEGNDTDVVGNQVDLEPILDIVHTINSPNDIFELEIPFNSNPNKVLFTISSTDAPFFSVSPDISSNIGIGFNNGSENTDAGLYNIFMGYNSGRNTTSTTGIISEGSNNIAFGQQSLYINTVGNENIAIGSNALRDVDTGDENVAVGSYALSNVLGSRNVAIGNNAGFNETGSDKLYIENSMADADNALIYGEFGTDNTTSGNILRTNSQFQIGNPSGSGYSFPTTDGTNGQVMTTDGSGNVSFQNITGDGNTQNTLDQAYNEGGLGAGRTIYADNGNVEILGDYGIYVDTNASIQYGSQFISNSSQTESAIYGEVTSSNNLSDRSVIKTTNALTSMNVEINKHSNNTGQDSGVLIDNSGIISGRGVSFEFSDPTTLNNLTTSIGFNHDVSYNGGTAGDIYGFKSHIEGSGGARKFGLEVTIPSTSLGEQYGIFSDVQSTLGYAGYFIGSMSFGNNPSIGRYLMPLSDGTAGQVMTTDGTGNITFQNPTTNTDNQQIENFSFNSSTNILTLELEDDGQPAQNVDLSALHPTKSVTRITMNSDQSVTGAGATKVNFDTIDFDINGDFNATSEVYEVPADGVYRVTTQLTMNSSTSTDEFSVRVRIDGAIERRSQFNHSGNGIVLRQLTTIFNLSAGQTIDISFSRPLGGATILSNSAGTFFEIEQL